MNKIEEILQIGWEKWQEAILKTEEEVKKARKNIEEAELRLKQARDGEIMRLLSIKQLIQRWINAEIEWVVDGQSISYADFESEKSTQKNKDAILLDLKMNVYGNDIFPFITYKEKGKIKHLVTQKVVVYQHFT